MKLEIKKKQKFELKVGCVFEDVLGSRYLYLGEGDIGTGNLAFNLSEETITEVTNDEMMVRDFEGEWNDVMTVYNPNTTKIIVEE